MRRESPYPMVPIEEAQRLIAAHTRLLEAEPVDALSADGRVLAEDVFSTEDMPDMPKAAVDGYALRAGDGLVARQVLAELTAGTAQGITVEPGTAVRIMTGAPLPPGADTVVMVEQTEEQDGVLHIQRAPQPGEAVHTVGQDIGRGALVLARGTVLGPAEIGLLATLGRTRVQVARRPRVAVLATGDEVFEPDALPEAGGIRDSNRYALLAAVREAGGQAISLGIARDDAAVQRAAILEGLEQADLLLTSGGVSMGTRDLIKPLLAELGTVHFGRVAYKPGKPTTFATVRDRLVFGLPGYPVSSLVSFEVFVRPVLRRMQGDARPERPRVRVALAQPITPSPDRPECQRATVFWQDGRLMARSTGAQGSSRLLSLLGANALLVVPPGTATYPAGAELEAILTGPLVEG
ncbi:MAG: molybdopterin molybdotransferase MoeA [Roseiflexaceae bacterium]